jgi:alpha/beta superfamily hydrolase
LRETHITFPGGDVRLEGVWHFPEPSISMPAVVVCHPYPLYGGDMSNTVVVAICKALAERSIAALRFNFRGVGGSEGAYGDGIKEQGDVRSALTLVFSRSDIDRERVGLVGYSFGARVALSVAVRDSGVSLLALVSPASPDSGWEQIKGYPHPVLVITGEHDFVMPPAQVQKEIKGSVKQGQFEFISGADHFWRGYESVVAYKVAEFFAAGLNRT